MNIVRFAWIAPLALAIGCGDDGGGHNTPDAQVTMDSNPGPDARTCTAVTPGTLDFYTSGDGFVGWNGEVTGDLGDGSTSVLYRFEFYDGIESSLAGTFDLTAGKQNNYATCAICVRAFSLDADGNLVKQYFQSGGSITLTEDPFTNQKIVGSLTDLQLEEVTVDSESFESTPVPGGTCASFGSYSVDHDRVPNAWTCTHADYDEGTNCNCMCGLADPDCYIDPALPVAGCTTAGDACFNDACVTPPTNDTCAAADTITLGTPVTGTTKGAARNYDGGLEGDTCTGFSQPGSDVVYKLTLAADQSITVTLSNLDADFDASVALVGPGAATLCDAAPIATCVAGADGGLSGDDETFTYAATAGTYYIIVDSYSPAVAGAFTLTVTAN